MDYNLEIDSTCGECAHNWMNEECELHGHEIYEDNEACDDFEDKGGE